MTELSQQRRKDWWMTLYAVQSFNLSLPACKLLLKLGDQASPYYPSLIISIHGYYGRPFKKQQGVSTSKRGIEDRIIPIEFSGLHKFLIDFRDKVLLHNDGDDFPALEEPINLIRLAVRPRGNEFHSVAPFFHPIETYKIVPNLLEFLIEKFTLDHQRMEQEFSSLFPDTPGQYVLNLKQGLPFVPWDGGKETALFQRTATKRRTL